MSNPIIDDEDMVVVEFSNGARIRMESTSPPHDHFNWIVISAIDSSLVHSPVAYQPVLDIWQMIEPDIIPLFKSLEAATSSQSPDSDLLPYKNTEFVYGITKNNKFYAFRSR